MLHYNKANAAAIQGSMSNFLGSSVLILTLILTCKLKLLLRCSKILCEWSLHCKIINGVMNKCKTVVDNVSVLNRKKRKFSMTFFQNSAHLSWSVLYYPHFLTDKRIDYVFIQNEEIISLIRNLNPHKASGADGISAQMLLLCDNSGYFENF